jgi:hypothetical protein
MSALIEVDDACVVHRDADKVFKVGVGVATAGWAARLSVRENPAYSRGVSPLEQATDEALEQADLDTSAWPEVYFSTTLLGGYGATELAFDCDFGGLVASKGRYVVTARRTDAGNTYTVYGPAWLPVRNT